MARTEIWRDAARVRRLPLPTSAPPGPVDVAIGYLLARAAPFDAATQAALRRQRGWGRDAPRPITEVRTAGRWQAVPALHRLVAATPPPASLLAAVDHLVTLAPCWSGEAVADLMTHGLLREPMHPAGVLTLAELYQVETGLELTTAGERTVLWPLARKAARREAIARLASRVATAGLVTIDLGDWGERYGLRPAELELAIEADDRLEAAGSLVWRRNDEASALARHVCRLLVAADGGLPLVSIADGLGVAWRFESRRSPTADELAHWVEAQPWLSQCAGRVCLNGALSPRRQRLVTQSSSEVLARVLRAAPEQTMTHDALVAALMAAGYARAAAMYAIATSPILTRPRYGHYRLRVQ